MIHEYLNEDGVHGVSMRTLMRRTGLTKYQIEKGIALDLKEGYPIARSMHPNPRYYLCSTLSAWHNYCLKERARVNRENERIELCFRLMNTWERIEERKSNCERS